MMTVRSPRQLYHQRTSKYKTIHQIITVDHLSLQQITRVLLGHIEGPQQVYASSRTIISSFVKAMIKES